MTDPLDAKHWHKTDGETPSAFGDPPICCVTAFDKAWLELDRRYREKQADALHAERYRIVTEFCKDIENWRTGAMAVLVDPEARRLTAAALDFALDAIKLAGCICPRIDTTSLGSPERTSMPGYDPRCGVHGRKPNKAT